MKKNEKINWRKKLDSLSSNNFSLESVKNWKEVYHLIVIPTYKEPLEVLRDTFKSLVKADYPKEKMIVVLACEDRIKQQAQPIAFEIEKEFGGQFFKFLTTYHPVLPGELAGKGANETFKDQLSANTSFYK
jgi:cellulose synthase/poly-beta-1,6-N-acetylglucosamine synthase-like glycosyltransferase